MPEATRAIGQEAFPKLPERHAWAIAQILWERIEKADAVAVWNGSRDFALAAVRIAEAQGKRIVYVENGFLPGTYQIDLRGINFASSLATLTTAEIRAMDLPEIVLDCAAFRQRPLGRDTGLTACDLELPSKLPRDFVLYAAQVHDDSQIARFSPDFRSVEAAIRYVAAECAAANLPLIVKEHPSDHGRIDYGPLRADLPDVLFCDRAPNAALVAACRAFVTVNSSMALQAVHAGKPVFALGDAAYNLPGVVTRIRPPARLRDALAAPEVDEELRRRYLTYLATVALVPCKSRIPDDDELRAVVQRIAALAANSPFPVHGLSGDPLGRSAERNASSPQSV